MDFFSKYKFSIWIVLALIVLNIATLIFMWATTSPIQHRPSPPHERNRMEMFERMKQELQLNKDQIERFDEITKKHLDDMKAFRDSIQFYKDRIIDESFSPNNDAAQIEFLSVKIGQFQAEIEKSISNHFIGVNKICTPEQTQKLKDIFGKIRSRIFGHEPPPKPN